MTDALTISKVKPEPTIPKETPPTLCMVEAAWHTASIDASELVTVLKANCERVRQMSKNRAVNTGWRNRREAKRERMAVGFVLQDLACIEQRLRRLYEQADEVR